MVIIFYPRIVYIFMELLYTYMFLKYTIEKIGDVYE